MQFEHFVAHLLEAMGYRTRVTQATGDGGVDVIAHRDALGLEPPIVKVQCKRTTGSIGGLMFSGSPGPSRRRLINGNELVELVFEHYEKFSPEYKRLLPTRSVYVVDRVPTGA